MTSLQLYAPVMPGIEPAADFLGLHTDPDASEGKARRALNVAVAAARLIVAAPLMLGIAILIPPTPPGPILYRQGPARLGRRPPGGPPGPSRPPAPYGR